MIDIVHILEVAASSFGALLKIETFVHEAVDREPVYFACGEHELPDACRARRRYCCGIEGGLDNGQILEFEREVVAVQRLFDEWEVEIGQREHIAHESATLFGI